MTFEDDEGNHESLTSAATDTIEAKPEPLTVSFSGVPSEYRGNGTTFTPSAVQRGPGRQLPVLRDEAIDVTGGDVHKARRVASATTCARSRSSRARRHRVGPLAGDEQLQRQRRHLHQRRLPALELAVRNVGRPGGALGRRGRGRGEPRPDARLHGEPGLGGVGDRDG